MCGICPEKGSSARPSSPTGPALTTRARAGPTPPWWRPPARLARGRADRRIRPLPDEPGGPGLPAALAAILPPLGLLLPALVSDRDLDWAAYEGNLTAGATLPRLWRPEGSRLGVGAISAADIVLVPALAVDMAGTRLGRGGGSYDRALARVRPGVPVIALLYPDELVPVLPSEPYDRPVTAVLTPAGLVPVGSGVPAKSLVATGEWTNRSSVRHHWRSKCRSARRAGKITEATVPTYQYACTACGHQLEVFQSFTDAALTSARSATGRLRKLFSAVGIVFKGSGFYRTDSRSGSPSADGNGGADGGGGAAKEAAKETVGAGAAKSDASSSSRPTRPARAPMRAQAPHQQAAAPQARPRHRSVAGRATRCRVPVRRPVGN